MTQAPACQGRAGSGRVICLLLALFYGTSVLGEELDGKTLTYLLTRPISRIAVYAGRLAAVQLLAGVLLALLFEALLSAPRRSRTSAATEARA